MNHQSALLNMSLAMLRVMIGAGKVWGGAGEIHPSPGFWNVINGILFYLMILKNIMQFVCLKWVKILKSSMSHQLINWWIFV